ncbi:MAG TPA: acyltransferase [Saprospiraceae bacterium]|nr:acyltransferase [Saprospiraceae bacterium]
MRKKLKTLYILLIKIKRYLIGHHLFCESLPLVKSFALPEILRHCHANVGSDVSIKSGLVILNSSGRSESLDDFKNLTIGQECYIGEQVILDLTEEIRLGKEVVVSARVSLFTHQEVGNRMMSKSLDEYRSPILLGDGVYLGTGAIVLPGVRIGKMCVVGAGAVVTQDLDDFSVAVGVPAKVIRKLIPMDL